MESLRVEAKNPIKSVRTAFRIIEVLKEIDGGGVTEIARELNLPKSSVHNYLSTLAEEEYVVKDGSEYHVGLRFLTLGSFARQRYDLYRIAKSEIDELAEQTGEVANLFVEEHGRGVYIYRKAGGQAVTSDVHTGLRVHLHNTALGKALLSHLPREYVEWVIDRHGLPQTREATITDREALFEELERIRERGVAFDYEERLRGVRCVASPIVNADEEIEGVISVAGPASRMKGERFESELPEMVRNSANVVEVNISYS